MHARYRGLEFHFHQSQNTLHVKTSILVPPTHCNPRDLWTQLFIFGWLWLREATVEVIYLLEGWLFVSLFQII